MQSQRGSYKQSNLTNLSPTMESRKKNWIIVTTCVLVAIAAIVLFAHYFNWNHLRKPIERRVSAATGRTFSINGDIDVRFHWHPVVTVDGVSLSNAPWGTTPVMAQIGHAQITLDLLSLFHKEIIIPTVEINHVKLVLEKKSPDVANWIFDTHSKNNTGSNKSVAVHQLIINDASARYLSDVEHADLTVTASTIDSDLTQSSTSRMIEVKARGTYRDLPLSLQGKIGVIDSMADLQKPYPLSIEGSIGATYVNASGTVAKLAQLQGLDLQLALAGASLADLFPILGVPLPPSPAYSVGGRLSQRDNVWNFQNFSGRLGNSDLHGQFLLNRTLKPQYINADLQSESLNLKDLSGLIGGRSDSGKPIVNSKTVLPHDPFNFEKLHAADAEVKFRGKKIQTQRLPLEDMSAVLKLNAGVLELKPVSFGVARGHIDASIHIDSNHDPIESAADITIRRIQFGELFPQFKLKTVNAGVIGGRVKLAGQGNSIADMLGTANGQAAFLMNGGTVSNLVVRLANLDVANSLVALLGGDKSMPIRCMVTDMKAVNGKMTADTMLLDTEKSLIQGQGSINFADETLDLRLTSRPKDKSLLALKGPIDLSGTFKNPHATPSLKNVGGRAALAAVLGSVLGPLAFAPLLELGGADDANCAALISNVKERVNIKMPRQKPMNYKIDNDIGFTKLRF